MLNWLNEVAGPGYAQAVLWTGLALLLLLVVLVLVKLVRSMTFGTFVAGGRNRKARLAVMDAAAVDSHRRLVLIRRDDVEHLLLIGGPSDLVVERDIRPAMPRRQPVPTEPAGAAATQAVAPPMAAAPQPAVPRARAAEPIRPVAERTLADQARGGDPMRRMEPAAPARPAAKPEPAARLETARMSVAPPAQPNTPPPSLPARTLPRNPGAPSHANAVVALPPPAARANGTSSQDDLDDELLKELAVSLDDNEITPKKTPVRSLDDEMSKLLGELSNPRR